MSFVAEREEGGGTTPERIPFSGFWGLRCLEISKVKLRKAFILTRWSNVCGEKMHKHKCAEVRLC